MSSLCSQLLKKKSTTLIRNRKDSSLNLNISQVLENSWRNLGGKETPDIWSSLRFSLPTTFVLTLSYSSSSPRIHHPILFLIVLLSLEATYFKAPKRRVGRMYPTVLKKVDHYQVSPPPLPTVLECLPSNGSPCYLLPVKTYLAHGASLDRTQILCILILWFPGDMRGNYHRAL